MTDSIESMASLPPPSPPFADGNDHSRDNLHTSIEGSDEVIDEAEDSVINISNTETTSTIRSPRIHTPLQVPSSFTLDDGMLKADNSPTVYDALASIDVEGLAPANTKSGEMFPYDWNKENRDPNPTRTTLNIPLSKSSKLQSISHRQLPHPPIQLHQHQWNYPIDTSSRTDTTLQNRKFRFPPRETIGGSELSPPTAIDKYRLRINDPHSDDNSFHPGLSIFAQQSPMPVSLHPQDDNIHTMGNHTITAPNDSKIDDANGATATNEACSSSISISARDSSMDLLGILEDEGARSALRGTTTSNTLPFIGSAFPSPPHSMNASAAAEIGTIPLSMSMSMAFSNVAGPAPLLTRTRPMMDCEYPHSNWNSNVVESSLSSNSHFHGGATHRHLMNDFSYASCVSDMPPLPISLPIPMPGMPTLPMPMPMSVAHPALELDQEPSPDHTAELESECDGDSNGDAVKLDAVSVNLQEEVAPGSAHRRKREIEKLILAANNHILTNTRADIHDSFQPAVDISSSNKTKKSKIGHRSLPLRKRLSDNPFDGIETQTPLQDDDAICAIPVVPASVTKDYRKSATASLRQSPHGQKSKLSNNGTDYGPNTNVAVPFNYVTSIRSSSLGRSGNRREIQHYPLPTLPINTSATKFTCKCKASKCIKLYCECFQNGGLCGDDCRCTDCKNSIEHCGIDGDRTKAIRNLLRDRPDAFDKKAKRTKGCSCKGSKCIKKYCVCFANGNKCDSECRCLDCQNGLVSDVSDSDLRVASEIDSGIKEVIMTDTEQMITPCQPTFFPQDMAPVIVTGPTLFANI